MVTSGRPGVGGPSLGGRLLIRRSSKPALNAAARSGEAAQGSLSSTSTACTPCISVGRAAGPCAASRSRSLGPGRSLYAKVRRTHRPSSDASGSRPPCRRGGSPGSLGIARGVSPSPSSASGAGAGSCGEGGASCAATRATKAWSRSCSTSSFRGASSSRSAASCRTSAATPTKSTSLSHGASRASLSPCGSSSGVTKGGPPPSAPPPWSMASRPLRGTPVGGVNTDRTLCITVGK